MPEHLRSVFVIFFAAVLIFATARRSFEPLMMLGAYERRRNTWLILTLAAFLSPNFWIFSTLAAGLLLWVRTRDHNPAALFLGLLLCLPALTKDIPGFAGINFLFGLSPTRLLALTILLPAALALRRSSKEVPGTGWPDLFFGGYLLVRIVLTGRDGNITVAMRESFLLVIDNLLPYYVLSRGLQTLPAMRDGIATFVLAALVIALLSCIEAAKRWLLFQSLAQTWGISEAFSSYLSRDGLLRVQATAGHAIALGYLMMIALALYAYVARHLRQSVIRKTGYVLLAAGLFVPLSRGPWIGMVAALLIMLGTGKNPLFRVILAGSILTIAAVALPMTSGGTRVVNLLPFVGNVDKANISYRQLLLDKSLVVLERSPFFGVADPQAQLAELGLVQGQGIVDIVNTYLQIALNAGLAGLVPFCLFLGTVVSGILRSLRRLRAVGLVSSEEYMLGRCLAAATVGAAVVLASCSSIGVVPWLYWCLAGAGVAYARIVEQDLRSAHTPPSALKLGPQAECLPSAPFHAK